jgi:hypothetical protein
MGEELEMVRSLVRSYMLGEQVDVAYCMTTLLAEVDRLRSRLEVVRELHTITVGRVTTDVSGNTLCQTYCCSCGHVLPCPTSAALRNEGGDE